MLSDEGSFGGDFDLELGELPEGEHRCSLAVPILLEPPPRHAGTLDPQEVTMVVDFVYHVFLAKSSLECSVHGPTSCSGMRDTSHRNRSPKQG